MNTRRRIPPVTAPLQEAVSQGDVVARDKAVVVEAPSAPEPKEYPPKIAAALLKITREISTVEKRGNNKFHGYTYPKWEDVLTELGPKITANGLLIMQNEIGRNTLQIGDILSLTYNFTIINEDGDVWPDKPEITSICKLKDSKNVLDDKAASKCHTQAQKYFLMGLFKVRTRDMAEADHDADGRSNSNGRRMVPGSNGRYPPHAITIIQDETPTSWAARLLDHVGKVDTMAELDAWDQHNGEIIDRIRDRASNDSLPAADRTDAATAYNQIVDAFAAKQKAITAPKGTSTAATSAPAEKKESPSPFTDDERDWLDGLEGAFSGCEDEGSLESEAVRLLDPMDGKVSDAAWKRADEIYNTELRRIMGL